MTLCFFLASVSWACKYKWHLCFPWRPSGASSFSFLSWRSPVGASVLPKDAIHRLWSSSFLQNRSEELVHTDWQLLSKKALLSSTELPSTAECHSWKGWKNLSLGCFVLESSQQMVLGAIFCSKVSGRTSQQSDQLCGRRQDVARKIRVRTEALYSTWWRKTLGNTRNPHRLMLLPTFSAS